MKVNTILFSMIFMGFVSCNVSSSDPIRNFAPGKYTRMIDNEFSRGGDTLIIRQLEGNNYEIEKRSGIIRIREGQEQPYKHEVEKWAGIYNEDDKNIFEQRKGRVISFVPDENKLLVGSSPYYKIK